LESLISQRQKAPFSEHSSSKKIDNLINQNFINKKVENFLAKISLNTDIDIIHYNTSIKELELNSDNYLGSDNNSDVLNKDNKNQILSYFRKENDQPIKLIKYIKTNVLKSDEKENDFSLKTISIKVKKEDIEVDWKKDKNNSRESILKLGDFGFKNKKYEKNSNFNIIELFDINKIEHDKRCTYNANQYSKYSNNLKKELDNKLNSNETKLINKFNHTIKDTNLNCFSEKINCSDKMIENLNKRFMIKDNREKERLKTIKKYRSDESHISNSEKKNNSMHLNLSKSNYGKINIITASKSSCFF
jgi:hypothetical protein